MTSSEMPSAIARAIGRSGSKSAFGPPSAFSAFARMRAIDVFPVPRGPGEEVRLPHLAVLDRVPQRADDGLLTDHVPEVERAVRAIQGGQSV